MGTFHARTIAEDRDSELVYVHDTDPKRGNLVAERFGSRSVSEPHSGVDALVVASPSNTHVDYVAWAIGYGLPVLVEKPLALSDDESARFADSPLVKVGHCERFNPAFLQRSPPSCGNVVIRRIGQSVHGAAHGDGV